MAIHDKYRVSFDVYNSSWIENDIIDLWLNIISKPYNLVQVEKFHFGTVLFHYPLTEMEMIDMADQFILKQNIVLLPIFITNHFYLIIVDLNINKFIVVNSQEVKSSERVCYEKQYDKIYDRLCFFMISYNSK